ncbi:MAG: electron transfer flavoprotein subunit alpha [Crocinitomicaceae bacterium]|nr:electron transfer flavoprotein subunit alpha [Crocinitomicaceae bacterium]|tara:strand:+ start:30017 stop:30757 length:741 start_codon:yes stop_codon:yes gene_type:complete
MKILVCISKAPDTTTKIAFTDGDTKFNEAGVQFIVNPYDEWYALVRGLELKESLGGSVTTVTVGGAENDPIIRKALAIGADDAVRIDTEANDAFLVAKEIANYASDKGYDLILCGKETINYNGGQVAGLIAEFLDYPFVSQATKIDIDGSNVTLECDVQGGSAALQCSLPMVLSAAKGMAEQRIPNMRGIMAARSKKLEVVSPSGEAATSEVIGYSLPDAKSECKYIDPENAGELIELLHNEAKVI